VKKKELQDLDSKKEIMVNEVLRAKLNKEKKHNGK
jgi:hypothetical protein